MASMTSALTAPMTICPVILLGCTVIIPAITVTMIAITSGQMTVIPMVRTLFSHSVCTTLLLVGMAFHCRSMVRVDMPFHDRPLMGVDNWYWLMTVSNNGSGNGAEYGSKDGTFNSPVTV